VSAFADGGFDLVLMDLQMPRMDGIAATASIRQTEGPSARVPILALTANVLKGVREECFAAGMCGYLAKPVREHELLAAIEAVVPGLSEASTVPVPQPPPAAEQAEPFEITALVGSVNGSHRTLAGLLEDCRDGDFPELFAQLSAALEENELPKVQRAAHAIKGVIGVFHAPAAYAAAKRIEESARLGNAGALREQENELRRAVSELLTSLERFVAASPLLSRAA
jgi:CheY-like chemotaxis protein